MNQTKEKEQLLQVFKDEYGYNIPLFIDRITRINESKIALNILKITDFIQPSTFEQVQAEYLWTINYGKNCEKYKDFENNWIQLGRIHYNHKNYGLYTSITALKLFLILEDRLIRVNRKTVEIGWIDKYFLDNLHNEDVLRKIDNKFQFSIKQALRSETPKGAVDGFIPFNKDPLFYRVFAKHLPLWSDLRIKK